jgi:hypothetical protein
LSNGIASGAWLPFRWLDDGEGIGTAALSVPCVSDSIATER